MSASSTRLLLARHGQVAAEWHGRLYGGHDVPLSAHGEEQSRALAQRLREIELDAVVSSGLARADFAARLLCEVRHTEVARKPTLRIDRDLRELDRGDWTGMSFSELDAKHPGAWASWTAQPARLRPPGGESLDDLALRVLPCLERCARLAPGGTVAVVAHSWVLRVAVCAALSLDHAATRSFYIPTTGLVQIDWPLESDGRATLGGIALDRLPPNETRWYRGPGKPS